MIWVEWSVKEILSEETRKGVEKGGRKGAEGKKAALQVKVYTHLDPGL